MPKLFTKSKAKYPLRKRHTLFNAAATGRTAAQTQKWQFLQIDKKLAFIILVFICAGLVFTYSSSAFDSTGFFTRQLIFDTIGILAALFLSQMYGRLQQIIKPIWLMYGAWGMLIAVLFTEPIANVHRWIDVGPFNVQPSEIAKVTLVIYIADYLSKVQGKLGKNWKMLIKPLLITGITFFLMGLAPDLGTPMLMAAVIVAMLFVAGANIKHLFILALGSVPLILHQLIFYRYRLERVLSFLNPEATASTTGYQLLQSFLAVGSGGWFGKGLGNSELKLEYLPEAHTDFIFSIMCEELGLLRILIILVLFCWLLVRGVALARIAKNSFHSLIIFGMTLTICLQAFFNMGMAIGLLPTKGIALPFFSYGGSSVIMTLVMMGIILNMAATENQPKHSYQDDFTNYRNRNR